MNEDMINRYIELKEVQIRLGLRFGIPVEKNVNRLKLVKKIKFNK